MYVPEMTVAQLLKAYDGQYQFYIAPVLIGLPPQDFLAPNIQAPADYPGEWAIPLDGPPTRNVAFLLDPPTAGDFARLTRIYPNARFHVLRPPNSSEALQYQAFITAADQAAIQGVRVRFYAPGAAPGAAPLSERFDTQVDHTWGAADPPPPVVVRYDATLRLPAAGLASLRLEGGSSSQVRVDGYDTDPPRLLGAGVHDLVITTTVQAAGTTTQLLLAQNGAPELPLTAGMLFKPQVEPHGLTGYYRRGEQPTGDPALVRIDPVISFYWHITPLERPYTIEWKGAIYIPEDGTYGFGLEQISHSQLEIDGKQIINNQADNSAIDTNVQLTRGFHTIRLVYWDLANYSHVYLFWTPPGRGRSIIPSYFLWPEMAAYPDPTSPDFAWPTLNDSDGSQLPPGLDQGPMPGQTSEAVSQGKPPAAPPAATGSTPPPAATPAATGGNPSPATPAPAPPAQVPADLKLPPASAVAPSLEIDLPTGDPRSVAADSGGNLYVASGDEGKIYKFDAQGKPITSWAVIGRDGKRAIEPFNLVVQGDKVRVLDAGSGDLLTYNPDGTAAGALHLCDCFYPRGLLALGDGTLWIADTGGGKLLHVQADGTVLGRLGSPGAAPGQLGEPTALWPAPDGTVFVVEDGNGRVQHLAADGTALATWPIGHTIARDGSRLAASGDHLYVSLTEAGAIAEFDLSGKPLAVWQAANGAGRPSGLAIIGQSLAVAYPSDHRVLLFPLNR